MWKWSIFPKIIIDIVTQPGFELCGVADLSLSDLLLMWSGGLVWRIRAHPPSFLGSRDSNWRSDLISFRSKTSISKTCLYLVSCNIICLFWWKKKKKITLQLTKNLKEKDMIFLHLVIGPLPQFQCQLSYMFGCL